MSAEQHRFPPAIDLPLPRGGVVHIELPPPLTPYERLVDKVVRFVAGPERELKISEHELQGLDYDEGLQFEHVILRRCQLGEFILHQDRAGAGYVLEKARR